MVKIQSVRTETSSVKTFSFEDELCAVARPGQFVMLWIPGVDEIPLSLSFTCDTLSSVTVKEVGEATRALNEMKQGDIIGVRGPFGTHFKIVGKKALVVGGGTGTAPLMMLTEKLVDRGVETTVIEGAKTRDELLFLGQLSNLSAEAGVKTIFTT
ncbi:MAG: hypothetical protein NWF14_04235, partial [Candidatus Bathyarchaeota archaeon]|nr:hypothetical protein [Candidatus Bathyarchaeota archaeon]